VVQYFCTCIHHSFFVNPIFFLLLFLFLFELNNNSLLQLIGQGLLPIVVVVVDHNVSVLLLRKLARLEAELMTEDVARGCGSVCGKGQLLNLRRGHFCLPSSWLLNF